MPYQGKHRKKKRTHIVEERDQRLKPTLYSAIYHRGTADPSMNEFLRDWRRTFHPYTFSKLKQNSRMTAKDVAAVSELLSLKHLHLFTSSMQGAMLRLGRLPHGPTLTFRVESYSTACDALRIQKKVYTSGQIHYDHPPVIICNGFSKTANNRSELRLLSQFFCSLSPDLSVEKDSHLNRLSRVLFFHCLMNNERATDNIGLESSVKEHKVAKASKSREIWIEVRHYGRILRPVVIRHTFAEKRISNSPVSLKHKKKKPDITGMDKPSSETDGEGKSVCLPENTTYRDHRGRFRLKLVELGPRLTLRLLRVESRLCEGEIIYHAHSSMFLEKEVKASKPEKSVTK